MMFITRDTKSHTQMCLTFIFKVKHQGQVNDSGFSEIFDIGNVRIDTKNIEVYRRDFLSKSIECIQPELVRSYNRCI